MLYHKKRRVLLPTGPIGAWVSIDGGLIAVSPDTRGVYEALRSGGIVQRGGEVILVRAKFAPHPFNTCLVVHGTTELAARVQVGIKLTNSEGKQIEGILVVAGFQVRHRLVRLSTSAELRRIRDQEVG